MPPLVVCAEFRLCRSLLALRGGCAPPSGVGGVLLGRRFCWAPVVLSSAPVLSSSAPPPWWVAVAPDLKKIALTGDFEKLRKIGENRTFVLDIPPKKWYNVGGSFESFFSYFFILLSFRSEWRGNAVRFLSICVFFCAK